MNTQSSRRRSRIGWAIGLIALLYAFLAQQPLIQTQKISLAGAAPLPTRDNAAQSAGEVVTRANIAFEVNEKENLLWMSGEEGKKLLPIFGYPYIAGERNFILRPDQQGLTEIDAKGNFLWALEFGTPILSSSVTATISAWGLLDGSIKLLDANGEILNELQPSGGDVESTHGCVYGVAVSRGGETVASLYGLDPQYILVYAKNGDSYRLAYAKKLEKQVRTTQPMAFSGDGTLLAGRTADGLLLYDTKKGKSRIVRASVFGDEAESRIEPMGKDSFAFLLAKGNERFAGLIRKGAVEAFFPVDESCQELRVDGNEFLLRSEALVYRYRVDAR